MQVAVSVDTRELENKLTLLARRAGAEVGTVLRQESLYITQTIIRNTPPNNFAQGRAAVARDIRRVFTPLRWVMNYLKVTVNRPQTALIVAKLIRQGKHAEAMQLMSQPADVAEQVTVKAHRRGSAKVGSYTQTRLRKGALVPMVRPGTPIIRTPDPAMHIARRNGYGRVAGKRRGSQGVVKASAIVEDGKSLRDYIRAVQERVGWAKAGFASALTASGGSPPDWYGRLAPNSGAAKADFLGANPGIFAIAYNVKIPGYQRIVDDSIRFREKITQTKLDRVWADKGTNLGFATYLGSK